METQNLLELYRACVKPSAGAQPIETEDGISVDGLVCHLVVDPEYDLTGIKLIKDKKTQTVFVRPESIPRYVTQNISREMTKAYDFVMKVVYQPNMTATEVAEVLDNMRTFYNKNNQKGLDDIQIINLKAVANKWAISKP